MLTLINHIESQMQAKQINNKYEQYLFVCMYVLVLGLINFYLVRKFSNTAVTAL